MAKSVAEMKQSAAEILRYFDVSSMTGSRRDRHVGWGSFYVSSEASKGATRGEGGGSSTVAHICKVVFADPTQAECSHDGIMSA